MNNVPDSLQVPNPITQLPVPRRGYKKLYGIFLAASIIIYFLPRFVPFACYEGYGYFCEFAGGILLFGFVLSLFPLAFGDFFAKKGKNILSNTLFLVAALFVVLPFIGHAIYSISTEMVINKYFRGVTINSCRTNVTKVPWHMTVNDPILDHESSCLLLIDRCDAGQTVLVRDQCYAMKNECKNVTTDWLKDSCELGLEVNPYLTEDSFVSGVRNHVLYSSTTDRVVFEDKKTCSNLTNIRAQKNCEYTFEAKDDFEICKNIKDEDLQYISEQDCMWAYKDAHMLSCQTSQCEDIFNPLLFQARTINLSLLPPERKIAERGQNNIEIMRFNAKAFGGDARIDYLWITDMSYNIPGKRKIDNISVYVNGDVTPSQALSYELNGNLLQYQLLIQNSGGEIKLKSGENVVVSIRANIIAESSNQLQFQLSSGDGYPTALFQNKNVSGFGSVSDLITIR